MDNLPDDLNLRLWQYLDRPIILVKTNDFEVVSINQAAMGFFNIRKALRGVFWPGILDLLNVPSEMDLTYLEKAARAPSDKPRWTKLQYVDSVDSTERYLSFQIIHDLSGEYFAIELIDKTNVEAAVRSRSDFVSLATHQLRTPLAGINWNLDLLLDHFKDGLTADQLHMLVNANKSAIRMNDLIKALLQLSRVESGSLVLKPKPTEIRDLLNQVIESLQEVAKQRNIQLITSFHKSLPHVVLDGTLIGFVFTNLISNAIKYSFNDSEVYVFLSKVNNQLLVQVADSGIGIPRAAQKHVFEKFYREKSAIQHSPDGNGLGLHLCRIIAQRSHGAIWFESTPGKGTTFWFSVPLASNKEETDDSKK